MIDIRTNALFDCQSDYLRDFFSEALYPWELLPKIKDLLLRIAGENPRLKEISADVFVGENVKIDKSARILGPTVICDRCEIRTGAYIRGSVFVGEGSVVGNSSEVKNSILLPGVKLPHYNYVGDSVLGRGVHLGAGAICSNLKAGGGMVTVHADENFETGLRKVGAFLGDGVDVGCGCVLNPGTVIGKGSSVYPLNSLRGAFSCGCIIKSQDNVVKRR